MAKKTIVKAKVCKSRAVYWFALALILLSFLLAIFLYPRMPEQMVSHWNARGEPDDYMSKFWGLFLMPFISLGILVLFMVIPKIDPLRHNIEKFRKYFDWFVLLLLVFLFYIYVLSIVWNLGHVFNMSRALIPALGFLFFYIGVLVEKAKRNWFVGIRTPWTLSSDKVWKKTHKLGGVLFKILGVLMFLGLIFEKYAFALLITLIIFIAVFLIVYSYVEYRKIKR